MRSSHQYKFVGACPLRVKLLKEDCYSFEIDGIRYQTAEHYMMAAKARLFDDRIILPEILAANHPRQTQTLGRKIQGFQETITT